MSESILVVAAHPDDEVLGCGGTLAKYAARGARVQIAFLADGISSRDANLKTNLPELEQRRAAASAACNILGVNTPIFADFPDNQLDSISMLKITQTVEKWIAEYHPSILLSHHVGDVNVDHQLAHKAVVTACRPQPGHPVKTLLFFEIASSTEWQPPGSAIQFAPNWFEDITKTFDQRQRALDCYATEMRPSPHPRSIESVAALAHWRGATIGVAAAEAFVLGRQIV